MQQQQQQQQASSSSSSTLRFQDPLRWVILSYLSVQFEVCGLLIFIFIQHYIYSYTLMWISAFWSFYRIYFLHRGARVLHAATTPGGLRRPGSWVPCITSPYSLSESARTARAAPVPAIWSEERSAPRIVARSPKRERRGAREKRFDQDRRTIHGWHHQRAQSCQRGLEWIPAFPQG